jgi:excinuclease UvrABC nuclease subunit
MLPRAIDFVPDRDAEILAVAPAAPAVFLLRGVEGSEPYVSKTSNLRKRLQRLLAPPEAQSKRLNLRQQVRRIEYAPTGSDFESSFMLYRVLRETFPRDYRDRMRLRFAPLVRLNLDNPYARAYVTRRIASLRGHSLYYGPFASRAAAEKFLNDALDLFKMRRCDFDLDPDPAFPGCVYSEMKMCLAPCFQGCTDEQYADEVARVRRFLDTSGTSLVQQLEAERDAASSTLEFEKAAGLHQRLEKLDLVLRERPDIARRLDLLGGVIVQPSAAPHSVALFRVDGARIFGPHPFPVRQQEGKPQSMEARVTDALAEIAMPPAASALEVMEHLALLKHWHFRTRKSGELFLSDENGELPLRRIVRGISRVFRGEKAETTPDATAAREYWLARTREQPPG